ncbi:hypothetical protein [Clostridium sp. chh4-2]|nr:hypothetical protein [Clostridium sp. chh4-2]
MAKGTHRTRKRSRKETIREGTGPGKQDTDKWDSGFAPKNY